jgi:hypothetical protein
LAAVRVKASRSRQATSFYIVNGEYERTEGHTQACGRGFDDQGVMVVIPYLRGSTH